MKNNLHFLIVFTLLQLVCNIAFAQKIDARIANLELLPQNEILDSAKSISKDILLLPKNIALKKTEELLHVTKKIDLESYLTTLGLSVQLDSSGQINKLNSIYAIAEKNGIRYLMGWALAIKGDYYKEWGMYDSSMLCILEARDIFKKLGDENKLVSVEQTLADLYFAAGDYSKAEKKYLEIQKKKGDIELWQKWRKQTIRNNLALIDMKRGDYNSALQKFNQSLKEVIKRNLGRVDSIAQAYIYCQLAQIYLAKQDFNKFEASYKLGLPIALKYNQDRFEAKLYFYKSKYFLQTEKIDSSLKYALLAEKLSSSGKNKLSFRVKIFNLLGNIYEFNNDYEKSNFYLKNSIALNDSVAKSQMRYKHMQMLAEASYKNLQFELERKNDAFIFSVTIASILILVLSIILVLYIRLQKAFKTLVNKNIELAAIEGKMNDNQIESSYLSELEMVAVVNKFEKAAKEKKLFLKKDISIEKFAEIIGTNRTYLSKSINEVLGLSFTTYINNLRIKEAINLINKRVFEQYNIEGIADKCGFKSRSAFFRAFKLYTGVSPSFFIKKIKN